MFNARGLIARIAAAACFVLLATNFAAYAQSAQPQSVNPTASSVKEEQLLRELDRVTGRVTIPDSRAATLIQPEGREWRQFHQMTLPTYGGYLLLGMLGLIVLFYLVRGKVRIEGGRSGKTLVRFGGFSRFVHWLTAFSFVILALSGLNIVFGKTLLLPLVGESAFAAFSQWAKYAHNYLSIPFTLGLVFMLLIWIKDNFPSVTDLKWIAQGGGIIGRQHPAAAKFNAGQKLIFWSVILIGGMIAVTGYFLLFPFYVSTIAGNATRADPAQCRRRRADRGHLRSCLYRYDRHGRSLRGHGLRRGRCQLGQGASQHLGGEGAWQGHASGTRRVMKQRFCSYPRQPRGDTNDGREVTVSAF